MTRDYNQPTYSDSTTSFISGFNDAQGQIFRLHNLWLGCNTAAAKGNFIEWRWQLDTIWRELSADCAKKNEKFFYPEKDKLCKTIKNSVGNRVRLYDALCAYEIFLRRAQDTVGKGAKWIDTDDDDMD